jgi:hypothetical protein
LVSERGALRLPRVRLRRDAVSRATARRRLQGGDGHGAEAITIYDEFIVRVRVFDKVRHQRQHEGESPARCGIGGEQAGESPASCDTGGEQAATSVSRRRARSEGVGGASLIEANGDGDKSVWQDGNGGRLCVAPTTSTTMASREK